MRRSEVTSAPLSLEEGSPASPTRVLYILGAGHSGSTLLAMLLASHPDVCTVGEVKAPAVGVTGEYMCSCGVSIDICEFWCALSRRVEAQGARFAVADGEADIRRAPSAYARALLRPLHRPPLLETIRDLALSVSPTWHGHSQRVQSLSAALARAACAITGSQVFVDSSKTGLQLKYLLRNRRLDVKVLRLVRDGRGVALSYRNADGLSIAEAAMKWRRSNEEAEIIVSRLPADRWLDLRYERLCQELDPTMRAIFAFVGVRPLGSIAQVAASAQHVLGNNKMRLNAGAVRLDEKWRRTLLPRELEEFDGVAGPVNRRLGYQ